MSQATFLQRVTPEGRQPMHSMILSIELIVLASTGVGLGMLAAMEPPDGVLYAACLAGSIGGAICSVRIKPAESQKALLNLVLSNVIFGMLVGPFAVGSVCHQTGWASDFPLAVAVSGAMSGVGSGVAWIAIPAIFKGAMKFDWFAAAAAKVGFERKQKPVDVSAGMTRAAAAAADVATEGDHQQ